MFQGNPAYGSVLNSLADPPEGDVWRWSCHPTYRAGLIQAGHPVLFWITDNEHPDVPTGIVLVGESTGPAMEDATWDPGPGKHTVVPYAFLRLVPLAKPILRAELQQHPVLKDLEILRTPAMSNPQVVTPAQLDPLISDFGLTTRPLPDDVRTRIREALDTQDDFAELVITGPGTTDISVVAEAHGWSVWDGESLVATYDRWLDAYADALRRGDPDPAITTDEDDPVVVAQLQATDCVIWVTRTGEQIYKAAIEMYGDELAVEYEQTFPSVAAAVLELVKELDEEPVQ